MAKITRSPSYPAAENYYKLLDYKFVCNRDDLNSSVRNALLLIKVSDFQNGRPINSLTLATEILNYLEPVEEHIIPVFDLRNIKVRDGKQLWALLGNIQKKTKLNSLIVINIEKKVVKTAIDEMQATTTIFWEKERYWLLFPFEKDKKGNIIYYTELLGGHTTKDYRLLRNKLNTTHLTFDPEKLEHEDQDLSPITKKTIKQSPLFIGHSLAVQSFELIITIESKTLFEYSMEYILNTNFKLMLNEFSGYKITDSHFRLGSKIHIRDFIYAKRIFQNSFFTNRFAFICAKYLLDNHNDKKSLTIVGYGTYSQFLVNRIEKILQKQAGYRVNHNIIHDAEATGFLKKTAWNQNVFVIVPINTTFSTTIRIESLIQKQIKTEKDVGLISPSLNLILVTHGDFKDENYVKRVNKFLSSDKKFHRSNRLAPPPYKVLNWTEIRIASKTVSVMPSPPMIGESLQKYLFTVASELYLPDNCPLCFPGYQRGASKKDILSEEILFKTDQVSVTPELILDIPTVFSNKGSSFDSSVYINEAAHTYGHFLFNGKHYNHFVNPIPFYKKYQYKIKKWGRSCREELYQYRPDIKSASILLISGGDRNNSYFSDFINRNIFDDAATIYYYDVSGQYIENFVTFFKARVNQTRYIFFVDDIIMGGSTFRKLNDVIHYCKNGKSCDGVFTLISSANDHTLANIKAQTSEEFCTSLKYNAFYYLNIESYRPENCPLCLKRDRYMNLSRNSILDSVKLYFLRKVVGLNVVKIGVYPDMETSNKNSPKTHFAKTGDQNYDGYNPLIGSIRQEDIEALQRKKNQELRPVFQAFRKNPLPEKRYLEFQVRHVLNHILSVDDEIRDLFREPYSKNSDLNTKMVSTKTLFTLILERLKNETLFDKWYSEFRGITKKIFDDILSELILNILSELPFLSIKPVKEKVFFLTIFTLDQLLEKYETTPESFPDFRKIKFLLKKTALLGSNYAIHPLTIERIRKIYEGYVAEKQMLERSQQEKEIRIDEIVKHLNKKKTEESDDLRRYIVQIHQNLKYIERSNREFVYFFVAIIKEATYDNEASIIKLEDTIDNAYSLIKEENESALFYFLRLIKFENAFILKRSILTIFRSFSPALREKLRFGSQIEPANRFQENTAISSELQKQLDDEIGDILFNNYRLIGLKKYFGIQSDFEAWKKKFFVNYVAFIELIYLFALLKNDDARPENVLLESKTQVIIQHFFYLAAIGKLIHNHQNQIKFADSYYSGAYLVLKSQEGSNSFIQHNKLLVAAATRPYKPTDIYEIINAPIDEKSLTYIMFNGVSNMQFVYVDAENPRIPHIEKPWILWEIDKCDDAWHSPRGSIYPIRQDLLEHFKGIVNETPSGRQIFKGFTEEIFLKSNVSALKFIRLTDVHAEGDIFNEVRAVIGLFSKDQSTAANDWVMTKRLCLAFSILPMITDFIRKHFDAAILGSLRNSWKNLIEKAKFDHGQTGFLENYREQLESSKNDHSNRFIIGVLFSLLKYGHYISELMVQFKFASLCDFTDAKRNEKLNIQVMQPDQIIELIKKFYLAVVQNNFGRTKKFAAIPIFHIEISSKIETAKFAFSLTLFNILFSEILINAKKSQTTEIFHLTLKLSVNQGGLLMLAIGNNCVITGRRLIMKLNKPNANSTKGLGLVDYIIETIYGVQTTKTAEAKQEYEHCGGSEFTLKFPIASFKQK